MTRSTRLLLLTVGAEERLRWIRMRTTPARWPRASRQTWSAAMTTLAPPRRLLLAGATERCARIGAWTVFFALAACTQPAGGQHPGDAAVSGSGGSGGGAGTDAASSHDVGDGGAQDAVVPVFGLDRRPANATCHAPARPDADGGAAFPATLSATGCVDPGNPSQPATGLIFYDVNAPLWSDGASKRRWMALPDGAKISVTDSGDWDLPIGAVLVKTFSLGNQPVETRLLVHHLDGDWAGYSYAWRDDGSDADLLQSSIRKTFGSQEWTYPSRDDCLLCHTVAAGRSLGLETAQLNRIIPYQSGPANQMATLAHIGLFETPPAVPLPSFPTPTSTTGALADRARAYLHANCSNCHRPGGITETSNQVAIDLRYTTALADMGICNVDPAKGNFGYLGAKIVKPGDPSLSMLSIRMHTVIAGVLMPQIGRAINDDEGVGVIDAFITGLSVCP